MSVRPEWHVLNKNGEIVLKTYDKALAESLKERKILKVELYSNRYEIMERLAS